MVKIVSALLPMFTYKNEYAYFKTPYTPKKLTYGSFGRDIRLFFALAANLCSEGNFLKDISLFILDSYNGWHMPINGFVPNTHLRMWLGTSLGKTIDISTSPLTMLFSFQAV